MKRTILIFCLLILTATNLLSQQNDFPKLTGPYIGQKPPGNTPEIFAPGIITTGSSVFTPAFSPDGDECFFTVLTPQKVLSLMWMRQVDEIWQKPSQHHLTAPLTMLT